MQSLWRSDNDLQEKANTPIQWGEAREIEIKKNPMSGAKEWQGEGKETQLNIGPHDVLKGNESGEGDRESKRGRIHEHTDELHASIRTHTTIRERVDEITKEWEVEGGVNNLSCGICDETGSTKDEEKESKNMD